MLRKSFFLTVVRVLFVVLGISLSVYSIVSLKFSNFNLGNVFPLVLGVICILLGIFYETINTVTQKGFLKYVKFAFLTFSCFLILSFLAFVIATNNLSKQVPEKNADALIVLGAGLNGDRVSLTLSLRLNKAITYLEQNKNTICVVSGGQGEDEWVSEASAMKKYLIDRGIAEKRIIMEDKSTSTKENFVFSKKILDSYFKRDDYKIVFVTNDFHVLRSSIIAKKAGFDAKALASKSAKSTIVKHYSREYFALLWQIVFYRVA